MLKSIVQHEDVDGISLENFLASPCSLFIDCNDHTTKPARQLLWLITTVFCPDKNLSTIRYQNESGTLASVSSTEDRNTLALALEVACDVGNERRLSSSADAEIPDRDRWCTESS